MLEKSNPGHLVSLFSFFVTHKYHASQRCGKSLNPSNDSRQILFDYFYLFAILSPAVRDGRKYCLKEILKNSTDQYAGTGCPIS